MSWVEAIEYGRVFEPADRPRIRQAFTILLGRCKRWPTPAEFLEVMPRRVESSVPRERRLDSEASRAAAEKAIQGLSDHLRVQPGDSP